MNRDDQLNLAPAEPRHAVNHAGWAIESLLPGIGWCAHMLRFKTQADAAAALAKLPTSSIEMRIYEQTTPKECRPVPAPAPKVLDARDQYWVNVADGLAAVAVENKTCSEVA